jgi:adhesin/invasin
MAVNSQPWNRAMNRRKAFAIAGIALAAVTCRDAFAPSERLSGRIAVAPVLPSAAAMADFGLVLDGVRFIVIRPLADTLADTTVALPADVTEMALDLRVPLLTSPESLVISIQALSGTLPLFEGVQLVQVPDTVVPEISVTNYIGPAADSIVIVPRDPYLMTSDSLRFQVQGFNGGAPVTQFYVAWSSSDSGAAPISHFGVLRAPGARGSTWIHARTPSGASDSVIARFTPPATQLVVIAGGGQTDTVGTVLGTPLEVEARAADGLGSGGVAVRFRVATGGGSVADTLVVTDSLGRARTTGTLGGTIGVQSFEASVAGLTGSPVTFGALAVAGQPTQLLAVAGDAQLAVVGNALATRPSIRLRDAGGNPVAGVPVTFTVTAGGGSIAGADDTTDAAGIATAGDWTLGTTAGTNTLRASAAGGSLSRTFTATGLAGAVAQLVPIAGDLQSVLVGLGLPIDPAVRAQDQFGNPVAGASVTFAVAGGGGSVSGATQLTNATGIATVDSWTLGTLAGANQLTATLTGVTPVTFTATGLAGAATAIVKLTGDLQSAVVNALVGIAPSVRLEDQFGNPVSGAPVTFGVTGGGGLLVGATQTTDAAGVATLGSWRLGTAVGANIVEATSGSLSADFVADALVGIPAQIAALLGDGQSGVVNLVLAIAPAVVVRDSFNNPVPGVPVSFTPSAGSSVTGGSATTDADGMAQVGSWTLATLAGGNTLTATGGGFSVGFSATGVAGAATQLIKTAGDGLVTIVGQSLGTLPAVTALDQFNNPVADVGVTFAVTGGNGFVTGGSATTNTAGLASLGGWTLDTIAGTNVVTASAGGAPSAAFTATGLPDVPALLEKVIGDGQTAVVNTALTTTPVVRLADQYGNPIAGALVLFDIQVDGGTVADSLPVTDALGLASPGSWTIADFVTTNLLRASSAGVPAVQFTANALPDVPTQILRASIDTQTALINQVVSVLPAVEVRDTFFNPVPGVAVAFTVLSGGGNIVPGTGTVITDANGVARITSWTLGPLVGLNELEVTAPLSGSPILFSANAITTTATNVVLLAGNAQSGTVAQSLGTPYAVQVLDAAGLPVQSAPVHWAVDSLGGVMSPTSTLTDVNGIATSTRFLGQKAGSQTATATVGSLTPVVFTATARPDVPLQMLKRSTDPQTGIVASLITAPVVEVVDQYDNPVPDIDVTFSLAGLGLLGTTLDTTDAAGRATSGSWLLGNLVGVSTVTASVAGLADEIFTATGIAGLAVSVVEEDGNGQTGPAGQALPLPYRVRVTDLFGNPVRQITVNWEKDARAGGSIAPATVPTDNSGIAAATHTLGTTVGPQSAFAWVSGLADTVTFTATATAGAASAILKDGGDQQSAVVNTAVAIAPTVKVTDGSGAPVAGHAVTWAIASGSGSLGTPATVQTDAAGIATAPVWTLGTAAGGNGLTATSAGLSGSPLSFTATGTAGPAAQIAIKAGNGQSATVNTPVAIKPAVTIKDQFNNPVANVQVTFTPLLGGGSVTGSPATTNTAGDATLSEWKLGTASGTNTLRASVSGVTPVTFSAAALPGAPAQMTFLEQPARGLAGDTLDPPVTVAFVDQFGNITTLVQDMVTVSLGASPVQGAKLTGTLDVQAVNGVAQFSDLFIDSAGSGYTIAVSTFKVPGIETDPFDVGGVVGFAEGDGLAPVAAAWDPIAKWLFVPGQGNTLGLFDPADGRITQFPLQQGPPFGIAVDPQRNRLYVTTADVTGRTGALLVLDTRAPNEVIDFFDFQRPARGVDVDVETGRIFVAVDEDQEKGEPPALYVFDSQQPLREQEPGVIQFNEATLPLGVAFHAVDRLVYVAMPNLGVGVFDPAKGEHVTTIPIVGDKGAAGTYGVASDIRANVIYATNRTDASLSVIDPVEFKEVERVQVGELPEGLGVDADRGVAYIANSGAGTVSFIALDSKSGRYTVFATLAIGPTPKTVAVDAQTGTLYVPTFGDDRVWVVRP